MPYSLQPHKFPTVRFIVVRKKKAFDNQDVVGVMNTNTSVIALLNYFVTQ